MTRRIHVVLVVAALALAGGVAWLLLAPAGEGDRGGDRDGRIVAGPARGSQADAAHVGAPESGPVRPISSVAFAEDDPSLPAARAFEPWPKDGLALDVASRADGEPVADAEVLWFEFAEIDGDRLLRLDAMRRDPEDNARRMARRFKTDAAGHCVVPYCRELTLVMARKGPLFGGIRLSPTTKSPLKLEVAPDEFVQVRVRDPDGKPVPNVPLDVNAYSGPRSEGFLRFAADEQGEASLKNLGLFFDLFRFEPRANLAPGFPMQNRPEIDFIPSPPPSEPVELVLPPQGSVVVHVVDAAGAPLLLSGLASLRAVGLRPPATGPLVAPGDFRTPCAAGEARWSPVGLGLRVEAVVRFDDGSEARATGDGPTASGEDAEILVTKGVRPPFVLGRALDAAGEPLVERRFEARPFYEDDLAPTGRVRAFRTDFGGNFAVELGEPPPEKGHPRRPVRVEFTLLDGSDRVASAARELPPDAPDVAPLGEVTFVPAPIIAAGMVVDEAGAPVRYARIDVAQKVHNGADGIKRNMPAGKQVVLKDEGLATTSREDGKFEIRSFRSIPMLRLTATRTGYADEGVLETPPGPLDLKIVLKAGGSVEARLLLDPDIPRDLLRVRLRIRTEGGPPDAPPIYDREHQPEANGFVSFVGAPPGIGGIVVRAPSYGRKNLAAIDAVRVEAGGASHDPRLNPIDLRGALRVVELEVVDSADRPVGDAEYETMLADGSPGVRTSTGRGRVKILASIEGFDVRVTSPRRRSAFVSRPSGYTRVLLADPQAAVLAVPNELPRLDAGYEYLVSLDPVGDGPNKPPDPGQRMLDLPRDETIATPGREITLRVANPGRYVVRWRLSMRQGKGHAERGIDLGDRRQFVTFGEFDGDLRLTLAAPTERSVERTKQRLR